MPQARPLLFSGRWLRFSLRGMFVALTLFGIWLSFQVKWMRQRQEARRWIEQHETEGGWSKIDPKDVVTSRGPGKAAHAPWTLRLMGEAQLTYIHLDKSKLSEADIPRIEALQALFPEAQGVHVEEPGWIHLWPPSEPHAFLKYPSRFVGGKIVNRPVETVSPDEN